MAEAPAIQTTKNTYISRLNRAINACRRKKKITDEKNNKMLRTYASGYFARTKNKDPHPMNMIDRAVSIWMPFLVGGMPKIIIEPKINLQFKPFAYTFQLALNQWMKNMKFATRTLEPAVLASLFSQGIVKTGTQRADTKKLAGYLTVEGRPYAEMVDDSNYIFDITAKDREQYEFEGDEYILPTEEAKRQFPEHADMINPDFKLYGEQHPKNISDPEKIPYNELHNYSAFIDLWLPNEKVIITILPPYKNYTKILKKRPYGGPVSGPYDVLGYKQFKGSTIPIPPIYTLMELDTVINVIYAKARDQAERLKKIGAGEGGGEKDMTTARDAKDGDMCMFESMTNLKELTLGGVVPELYEFLGFSLGQFSEQGGNLTVAGGRQAMSKTLGQEQMLMSNASKMLDKMSQKVHNFASSIAEKLAYEMWHNPTLQISAIKKVAGVGEISVLYNQLQQEGSFIDYYLDVQMFSMQRLNPEARLQKLFQLLTAWILPTMQLAAQQGKVLNVPEVTKTLSLYMNVNTDSWFLSQQPENVQLNPYQMLSGSTKMKSSDQRFGASEADNANNALAQQTKKMGATTKEM